jgi:hypothetical protein
VYERGDLLYWGTRVGGTRPVWMEGKKGEQSKKDTKSLVEERKNVYDMF